jgi:hypothetical protein
MFALVQSLGLMAAARTLIAEHPYAALVALLLFSFAVLNAAVQAMEPPTEKNGPGYRYLYRFAHLVAFNFKYALRAKFPDYVPADDPKA